MKSYGVSFYTVGDKVWYHAPVPGDASAAASVVDVVIGHPAVTYCVQLDGSDDRVWVGARQLAPRRVTA